MFIDKEIILNYRSKISKCIFYYKITAGEGFGYNLILFYNLSIISTEKRKVSCHDILLYRLCLKHGATRRNNQYFVRVFQMYVRHAKPIMILLIKNKDF